MIPLFGQLEARWQRDVVEVRMISLALQLLQMNINVVLDFGCWGRDSRTALPCVTDRAAPADCARRSPFPGATTFTERFACGAGVEPMPMPTATSSTWRSTGATEAAEEIVNRGRR